MGLYSLSTGIPSVLLPQASPRRSTTTSTHPSSTDIVPPISTFATPVVPSAPPRCPPSRAYQLTLCEHGGAPSFSPVPPDRLKLQSVASPSVGTLIRGRLHCSGTLLAALGYQLFLPAPSTSPPRLTLFLSVSHCSPLRLPLSSYLPATCYHPTCSFCRFFLSFFFFLPLAPPSRPPARFFSSFYRAGSPYSWAYAPLPDNLRVKLLRADGIAFARAHGTFSLFSLWRAADDRTLPLASGFSSSSRTDANDLTVTLSTLFSVLPGAPSGTFRWTKSCLSSFFYYFSLLSLLAAKSIGRDSE